MRVTLRRLVAVAVFAACPLAVLASSSAPIPAPVAPGKNANPMESARKALDEVGDMNYESRTLNDVINDLKDKTKVPVILDNQVYNFGLDPNQPTVTVKMKQVKLKDGLKAVLAPYNLKFGLTQDGLYISTEEGVITKQLRQRVSVDCDGTEFAATMKQLASDTGANVVIDPRVGDKAKKAVTLKLEDVPLETAVRLLAAVADLHAIRSNNVLFVTTSDKVEKAKLGDDGPTSPAPVNPFFPGGVPVPGGFGGGFGGVQILPAVPAINPPPAVEQPAEKPVEKPAEKPAAPPVEKK